MAEWAKEEGYVQNGEVKLHYYADGPADGEPVILLHGFPQFSYEWRRHLPALAEQGYRVVAPDLRGYHLSDRPKGVEAYSMRKLIGDVLAIIKHFGWSSVNLVAHDWGGAIAWATAIFNPQVVKRLAVINMPHPGAFIKAMQSPMQLARSWYIWFIQAPEIPERVLGQNVQTFLSFVMLDNARPGTYTDEDRQRYIEVFSQPGQLEAAFNYYRANFNQAAIFGPHQSAYNPMTLPVLLVYGDKDLAFSSKVWKDTATYCQGYFRAAPLEGHSHWSVEEAPAETLKEIQEHLKVQTGA